ncbi:MAG: DedA family protein [Chloroflexi bacterium]|nr:DedA family protein [Chloroflexota bacterium]
MEEEQRSGEFISSPLFRQILNWSALIFALVFFVVPRVSPFGGLNGAINDLNLFRRFSEWLVGKTEDLFRDYGYYVVFFGVLAENSMFIGLLVPGSVILMLGGLSAENGSISIWWVIGLAIAGTMIGDTVSYLTGRLGWARFMEKGTMGKALEKMREPVHSNSVWIILGYHFAGYSRLIGPVAAGLFHIPYRRWAPLDYLGATLWVIVFTSIGVIMGLAGVEFGDTKRMVQILEIGIFAVFGTAVVLAFIRFNKEQGGSGGGGAPRPGHGHPATVVVPVDDN